MYICKSHSFYPFLHIVSWRLLQLVCVFCTSFFLLYILQKPYFRFFFELFSYFSSWVDSGVLFFLGPSRILDIYLKKCSFVNHTLDIFSVYLCYHSQKRILQHSIRFFEKFIVHTESNNTVNGNTRAE